MIELFLYFFLILCIVLLVMVIVTPKLILEFPYFLSGIFFVFIVPQAIILYNQPFLVPNGVATTLFAMCFFCLAMGVLGYYFAPKISITQYLDRPLIEKKVFQLGVVYTFIGLMFYILIWRTYGGYKEAGEEAPTQATGAITIYFFISQLAHIAFPIFLYLTLRRPRPLYIIMLCVAAFPFLYMILTAGRREISALFGLSIAMAIYYRYKIVPPRWAVVGMLVFAMLIIPATGDYRSLADKEGPVAALKSLDLQKSFSDYYNKGGKYLELKVAAHIIDSYKFSGNYSYGAGYWDQIVFRYVPAQIVGKEVKEALFFEKKGLQYRNGYRMPLGLTSTGIGDAYWQFGLLGSIFFFFMGGFFKSIWSFSLQTDNPLIQTFYTLCVVNALISVTHGTINFIPASLFGFMFLFFISRYAAVKD
ncbi:hypothetical protein [Paracnuella aquatica]|uniref:hypothetical protein n=1 Tax=Paracnuella aquatica TaxID=2268757 RepID=UPI000F50991E|nr:hypothetical protein [Paracnuella aquatica]RPD51609.1 hypothetical protein DRJ53_02715 [Paracnuella aquatica]